MPKTKEELNKLKEEYEELYNKIKELSDDELKQIAGGDYYFQPLANGTPVKVANGGKYEGRIGSIDHSMQMKWFLGLKYTYYVNIIGESSLLAFMDNEIITISDEEYLQACMVPFTGEGPILK